ncbi:MAG: class I SAM-dependent methyltransferase [Acidimicrobiales bacterium]
MNDAHLEFCASPEWRQILEEQILPDALSDVDLGEDVIEIGPGPGLTTDVLRTLTERLTVVEFDPQLAASLEGRLSSSNVEVLWGDAADLDLPDGRFTGAVSFHMIHHMATAHLQDRAFSELARVLRKGGALVVADAGFSEGSRLFHEDDIYTPIEPDELDRRLSEAGFVSIEVKNHDLGWFCQAVAA